WKDSSRDTGLTGPIRQAELNPGPDRGDNQDCKGGD
ncbi:MAG: hypothetical protein FD129_3398, partial [bacterium]